MTGASPEASALARCSLGDAEMHAQAERYRNAGTGASAIERTPRRLVVQLDRGVDPALVDELIAVERSCCPFFELEWEPQARRLEIAVAHEEHEPALTAIAVALGLPASEPSTVAR